MTLPNGDILLRMIRSTSKEMNNLKSPITNNKEKQAQASQQKKKKKEAYIGW